MSSTKPDCAPMGIIVPVATAPGPVTMPGVTAASASPLALPALASVVPLSQHAPVTAEEDEHDQAVDEAVLPAIQAAIEALQQKQGCTPSATKGALNKWTRWYNGFCRGKANMTPDKQPKDFTPERLRGLF
ncbi:hypothetical protein CYMTET_47364 [Cymbomonas tetramitiformis]|uniref:Uncharacterized protein n=1 Tax=Cymbomonas tetramitiformis TaxID=36881 RepID=A0AAE0EWR6_9CHLO|nr:hypothetical protein CYMTET_47364 [Cymbomonas tetramitiformis]